MTRFHLLFVCFWLFFAGWPLAYGADILPRLDFIHVNANTGQAAGGHSALKIGSTVFHYQFFPDNRFLLVRDSWNHFSFVYTQLRNRSLSIASLPVSRPTVEKIYDHFSVLLVRQQQNIARLAAVEQEQKLITALDSEKQRISLPGLGLFALDKKGDTDMQSLVSLLSQKRGQGFLIRLQNQASLELKDLVQAANQHKTGSRWPSEMRELVCKLAYYKLLVQTSPLTLSSVITPPHQSPPLSDLEREYLKSFQNSLVNSLCGLLDLSRPGNTSLLLIQTARFLVISRSLASGNLLTLDSFSDDAVPIVPPEESDLEEIAVHLREQAAQRRKEFFSQHQQGQITYTALENAQTRVHEVTRYFQEHRGIRVENGVLLPSRSGSFILSDIDINPGAMLDISQENRELLNMLRQEIDHKYAYDLISRNCATALLQALNDSFADALEGKQALGGWLVPSEGLAFVPFVLQEKVVKTFPGQQQKTLLSRRLSALNKLYKAPDVSKLWIWLHEVNTLTSSLYTPRLEDTPFLFFTDDTLILRPVLGAANLCWGAMQSVAGLCTLPMDGGNRLRQGARGVLYSLPELVFVNIRKGTFRVGSLSTVGP